MCTYYTHTNPLLANICLVPNPCTADIDSVYKGRCIQVDVSEICEANGIPYDTEMLVCEINIFHPDNADLDYQSHPPKVENIDIWIHKVPKFIPYTLIENLQEGDTIDLNLPIDYIDSDQLYVGSFRTSAMCCARFTACQTKSKFARFGKFQDAVRFVMKRSQVAQCSELAS